MISTSTKILASDVRLGSRGRAKSVVHTLGLTAP
jgi:hypothetical protein